MALIHDATYAFGEDKCGRLLPEAGGRHGEEATPAVIGVVETVPGQPGGVRPAVAAICPGQRAIPISEPELHEHRQQHLPPASALLLLVGARPRRYNRKPKPPTCVAPAADS